MIRTCTLSRIEKPLITMNASRSASVSAGVGRGMTRNLSATVRHDCEEEA